MSPHASETLSMNDYQIRTALKHKTFVRYNNDPETLILDELGLRHGAARIDIAVLNGRLHGFEIKSDRDTLKRLPGQAAIFNSVLDRITLVVTHRYAYEAMRIVPDWWGIKLAEKGPRGAIHFVSLRRPRNNPSPDIAAVAKLLWRDEALSLLEEIGAAKGVRSKPRAVLYARLIEVADPDFVHSRVLRQLKDRKDWRSGERRTLDGD